MMDTGGFLELSTIEWYFFYGMIGLAVLIIVLLILVILTMKKNKKLQKRIDIFMSGADAASLEEEIKRRFTEIETLKAGQESILEKIKRIDETLLVTYQKVGIIKYDAFKEMGGKLSFTLAMLNDKNDGFILNSMHSSREGCFTYIKEIIKGESFVLLSEEEQQALNQAKECKDFTK